MDIAAFISQPWNQRDFPILSVLGARLIPMKPASSFQERMFSCYKAELRQTRKCMGHDNFEKTMVLSQLYDMLEAWRARKEMAMKRRAAGR